MNLDSLRDPLDHAPLERQNGALIGTKSGARYQIFDEIPVLVPQADDITPTHIWAKQYTEKLMSGEMARPDVADIEGYIARHIVQTNGQAYRRERGAPIPSIPDSLRLPTTGNLLEIGCNWGRWSVAASRRGVAVTGIDPMLQSLLVAACLAKREGEQIGFICADGRYLPFADGSFDAVLSYSVLQHFSDGDCARTLSEVSRVLKPGGIAAVQMAALPGLRNLAMVAKHQFRRPGSFSVRYRRKSDLAGFFERHVGPTRLVTDAYLGLGLQGSDLPHMTRLGRAVTRISELLKSAERIIPPLRLKR